MKTTYRPGGGSSVYFASQEETDVAGKILAKIRDYDEEPFVAAIRERLGLAYKYYYGFDSEGNHATSSIMRAGEQGQLAKYRVNHSRSLVNTLLNLVISQRVVWQPTATNIDFESVRECEIAAAILEYYWHERQVEKYVHHAVEEAIAFTEGFVMMEWDDFLGEDVAPNPDGMAAPGPEAEPDTSRGPDEEAQAPLGPEVEAALDQFVPESAPPAAPGEEAEEFVFAGPKTIKSGDVSFENISSWNVVRDPNATSWEQTRWCAVRVWRNKHDLAARYPSVAEHILACHPDEKSQVTGGGAIKTGDDEIEVYYFFHKRTPAVPEGREVVLLNNRTVLRDRELTYENVPVFRVVHSDLVGTPYGYSPFLEVLGIQELIDSLHSGIATNLSTFTVQNVIMDQGTEMDVNQIDGALRLIVKPQGAMEPKALQLHATPPDAFKHLADLKRDQQTLFAISALTQGQIESDRLSGAAMALVDAQVKQQASGLHGSTRRMIQEIGNALISTLKSRCWAPRKIAIVGSETSSLVQEEQYDRNSFGRINRVMIDTGNPLSQSPAGRVEMASQLLQMGLVKTPEQYYQVLTTGRLDPVTKGQTNELMLVRAENEMILKGEKPVALIHDNHLLHGSEHRIPVSSPQARQNGAVLQAHMEHMHEHYTLFFGQQPVMKVPQVDPMTGMAIIDPMTGQPMMTEQYDPLYRERMLILMGFQPPAPPMGPPGAPPPSGGQPPPNPAQQAAEGVDPAEAAALQAPPGMEPGKAETAKLPSFPTQPATGQKWDPQTAGGAVQNQ